MKYLVLVLMIVTTTFAKENLIRTKKKFVPNSSQTFSIPAIDINDHLVLHSQGNKCDIFRPKNISRPNKIEGTQYNENIIRNLRNIDDSGNLIGPIDIFSANSSNPTKLRFKFTTNNPDFSVKEVHYQFFKSGEDIKQANEMRPATLISENGNQFVEVDMLDLKTGNYQVVLRVLTQQLQKKGFVDKHVRYAVADFERVHIDSAHAVLDVVAVATGGWRVEFSMANSYADYGGEIVSYEFAIYRGDELIESRPVSIEDFGTTFWARFKELGTYKVKLTVKDSYGDTDEAWSDEYEATIAAPVLKASVSQNPDKLDLINVDLTGSHTTDGSVITFYGVLIYKDGVRVGVYGSSWPKFIYQTPIRGEFSVRPIVVTNNRTNNVGPLSIFDVPLEYEPSILLSFNGADINSDDPREYIENFRSNITYDDFLKVEHKLTKSTGEVLVQTLNRDQVFFHHEGFFSFSKVNSPGDWIIETRLYDRQGRVSDTYSVSRSYAYDLGVASFDIAISPVSSESNANINLSLLNLTSGNYGYFTELNCEFRNISKGTTQTEPIWQEVQNIYLQNKGEHEVSCRGVTNTDLVASATTSYDAVNIAPRFLNIEITKHPTLKRQWNFNLQVEDTDGGVENIILEAVSPSGVITSKTIGTAHTELMTELGQWTLNFKAIDSDGAQALETRTLEVINQIPVVDYKISLVDSQTRRYRLDILSYNDDYPNYELASKLSIIDPSGQINFYENAWDSFEFNLPTAGMNSINLLAQDGDGAWSEDKFKYVEVINQKPVPVFELTQISVDRKFLFSQSSYDLDGWIVGHWIEFKGPNGENFIKNYGYDFEVDLPTVGEWTVLYQTIDNEGAKSDFVVQTINIKNIAPKASLTYKLVSSLARKYEFTPETSDLDGEIVAKNFEIISPDGSTRIYPYETRKYTFADIGHYKITLNVTDNDGASAVASIDLDIVQEELPLDPGEEGKLTLAGIDSDENGVRDDVQLLIENMAISEQKKIALKVFAKKLQVSFEVADDKALSIKNTYDQISQDYCLRSMMSDDETEELKSKVMIKHHNTKERMLRWAKAEGNFAGKMVFHDQNEAEYHMYCQD